MPRLSHSIEPALVCEWKDGKLRQFEDHIVGEEPLEIRVNNRPLSVTMRTPGHDLELAAGFLLTEGLVRHPEEIARLRKLSRKEKDGKVFDRGHEGNIVNVELQPGSSLDPGRAQRNFYTASSCGICGKSSIEAVRVRWTKRPDPHVRVDPDVLCSLPDKLRSAQNLFSRTGGLHAAGLFDKSGTLVVLREDVGRHNAVDKVVGWALLEERLPLSHYVLMVSGRGGFEIVQKAVVAGVPVLASVSAPSNLAVRLAREMGMTLVGFLRGRRFVVYSGEHRLGFETRKSKRVRRRSKSQSKPASQRSPP